MTALRRVLWTAATCGGWLLSYALSALYPIVRVRVGKMAWDRIGDFSVRVDLYLRRRARGDFRGTRDLFVVGSRPPANARLVRMALRHLRVVGGPRVSALYDAVRRRRPRAKIWLDFTFEQNEFTEFADVPPQVRFSAEEEAEGRALLARLGIAGRPFVCFHARDKRYLDVVHAWRTREQWSYHDHRDCDVANYLPAAEALAARGIPALRMGYMVEKPLVSAQRDVIDYASHHRSELGDLYLMARAKFFLGNSAGMVGIAQMFGVPAAAANWIPLRFALMNAHDLFIPKKLWDVGRRRFLTFREIFERGIDDFLFDEQYATAGIEVVENTADEILALATEMNERLDGRWVETPEDAELQERYRKLLPPGHHSQGFPSRLGARFLREHRDLLD